ncbi:uncharacterized protein LOC114129996 [Aphis gossypii]|uniref:Uncharacterized protein n=1 Tax=Aphis gossypii TaxID=80765 RepID=A0A9P0J4E4_APHGO|nr:uncharacterized protein LOC114129996 [Aphis gossypii]CAH1726304.1 unnamed protein product [Aphis gossypii]
MFLLTIPFYKNVLILAPFLFIIFIVMKRNLNIEPENVIKVESEETCTPEVIYFESMSFEEKLKKLVNELYKIKKCIPLEETLNGLHKCLMEIQQLNHKLNKTYHIEQVELNNAILWLEKSTSTRGKYKPIPDYDEQKIQNYDINEVKEEIKRLITKKESKNELIDAAVNTADINNSADIDNESSMTDKDNNTSQTSKAIETEIIQIPDVKLENILENCRHTYDRFLPLIKIWSQKLRNEMLDVIKMVYVTLMVIRHSIFNQDNWKNTINPTVSKLPKKLISIQTKVDNKDGVASINLELFPKIPETIEKSLFYRIINKIKSYF